MNPIKTKHTNRIIGAQESGWNMLKHGPVIGLPVVSTRTGPDEKQTRFESRWAPSLTERVLILFGRPVTLAVNSFVHPPVSLHVGMSDKPEPGWNPEHDTHDTPENTAKPAAQSSVVGLPDRLT